MGLKSSDIIFDNPTKAYYPGQQVTGKVELTFNSPKKLKGILIRFKGEANTSWSAHRRHGRKRRNIHYHGQEEYFNFQQYLAGGGNGDEIELQTGKHTFPFSYTLPQSLPTSFEGEHGYIRYTIKVTLERPWKYDQDVKVAFSVVSLIDLNLNPKLKDPVRSEIQRTFGCFLWKSGPLKIVASLPYSGFVPGQTIPISVDYNNQSNVEINEIVFKFRKVIKFYSTSPRRRTKVVEDSLCRLTTGHLTNSNTSDSFRRDILIPPLPPSDITHCGIIDVNYEIVIKIVLKGMHAKSYIKIPITIGTVPLIFQTPQTIQTTIQEPAASGSEVDGAPPPYHVLYPNIPPPNYQESEFKTTTIKDDMDNEYTRYNTDNFAPVYPVYNMSGNLSTDKK